MCYEHVHKEKLNLLTISHLLSTEMPSMKPSTSPTLKPTQHPTTRPSAQPSASPTCKNMAWPLFFVYCEWFLCLFFFFPLEDLKYSKGVFHIVGCFVAANENKLKHICTHISFYWILICSYLLVYLGFSFVQTFHKQTSTVTQMLCLSRVFVLIHIKHSKYSRKLRACFLFF